MNWEDGVGALRQLFEQRQASAHGAARLARGKIDESNEWPGIGGTLLCERQIAGGNPYHGNIVYASTLKGETRVVRMIAAALALRSEFVPRAD